MSSGVSPRRAQTEAAASANDSVSGIPGGDPASVPGTPLVRALNGLRIASAADLGAHAPSGDAPRECEQPPPHSEEEGRTTPDWEASFMEEEEADKGPTPQFRVLPAAGAHATDAQVAGAADVDSLLRDDRDRPRESVVLQLGNADRYEGEVLDGLMDGRGHYTFADGNVYVGEWRRGKKEGVGTFSWANGDVHDGEWVDGKMAGRGRIVLEGKLTYDGEWLRGKCHGQGQCRYSNGDKFVGEYRDGKRRGLGRLSRHDGNVYEGEWDGTSMGGHGTCAYADGSEYEGEWPDSMPPRALALSRSLSLALSLSLARSLSLLFSLACSYGGPKQKTSKFAFPTNTKKRKVESS